MPLVHCSSVHEESPDNRSHRTTYKNTYKNTYIPSLALVSFRPSIVRFYLPPAPPLGTERSPNPTQCLVVGTKDPPVRDIPKFHQVASKWTKADLVMLGVNYEYDLFDNIGSKIGIEDADVPPEIFASKNPFDIF